MSNATTVFTPDTLPRELPDRFDIEVERVVMEGAFLKDESQVADACIRTRQELLRRGFHVHAWIDHARAKYVITCTRKAIEGAPRLAITQTHDRWVSLF